MNKDKHVLPDDKDTFTDRVKREARKKFRGKETKTIVGPDNEILSEVKIKK